MKTRNLFLSLFAFAAVCACNKETQPAAPEVLDADTYVKVNIMATPATKAPTYASGEDDVKNALFLFFDASGAVVHSEALYEERLPGFTDVNNGGISKKSATIKLPAKQTKPSSMLVVLNYDSDNTNTSKYVGKPLATVKILFSEYTNLYFTVGGENYFLMTNSAYVNGAQEICEVKLTDANFGQAAQDQQGTAPEPVNVYVERVAAKVTFNDNTSFTTTEDLMVDESEIDIIPVLVGYTITDTPDRSYDFKHVSTSWDYKFIDDASWTAPTSYRSYWSDMITDGVNYLNPAYKDIETADVYTTENTSLNTETTTKVILTAKLTDGINPIELVRYNGTYYTLANFKNIVLAVAKGFDETVTTDVLEIKAGKGNFGLTKNYEMVYQLKDSYSGAPETKDNINNALQAMPAMYWKEGRCYYYTDIKHDLYTDPADAQTLLSGIVRNHVYQLTLNTVKGLGIPVPDETIPLDPETLADEFYSVNATVNILQWRVVSQDVSFDNN